MGKKVTISIMALAFIIASFAFVYLNAAKSKPTTTKKTIEPPPLLSKEEIKNYKIQDKEEQVIMKAAKKSLAPEVKQVPPPVVTTPAPTDSQPVSSKRLNWGYKISANGNPPGVNENYKSILRRFNGIYLDKSGGNSLYLTFDEGYENGFTPAILDVLKNHQVPAAFFVTGTYVTNNATLVKRMDQEGHIIANHTWHHYNLSDISVEDVKTELDYVKNELAKVIGQKEIRYMRPPTGAFSELSLDIANKMGYQTVFWSVAYKDWVTTEQKGSQHAYDTVMPQIHPGAIILLHAVSKDNAEALDKIITDLKAQGYIFKSLDQYGK
ncbi:MAG: delta-lactam-biosynthetic de-N-acetylase [Bacillales bacterium]|jgi:peptidoglycan-N-acetylmuramic acid deacetylase|nr:delta-lactam-biosynthetic de-N-acetylase [Bacillales bacterium]